MSRVESDPVINVEISQDVLSQLGIDPATIPNLTEAEALDFMRGINPHITKTMVRRAVLKREMVPVRKGKKFLFSKREAIRWMQTSEGPLAGHNRGGGDAA